MDIHIIWSSLYSNMKNICKLVIITVIDSYGSSSSWDKNIRAAAAKSLQLCPILCNPIDSSPSGSPVPGILQARTLKWVAISFSNAWKWKVKVKLLSRVWLFTTPWTEAYQAPYTWSIYKFWHRSQYLSW